jgi:hypothetical protein
LGKVCFAGQDRQRAVQIITDETTAGKQNHFCKQIRLPHKQLRELLLMYWGGDRSSQSPLTFCVLRFKKLFYSLLANDERLTLANH